jgi:hypothetical protein
MKEELSNEEERGEKKTVSQSAYPANGEKQAGGGIQSFSRDADSEDSHPFRNDKTYPPSSTVLELRAASCIIGLENYAADDLLDKLGSQCHAGKLNALGWPKWFFRVLADAQVNENDLDLSMKLGNQLFAAFASKGSDSVEFSQLAPGLALFCLKSPLEERLMVAFTIVDK